MKVKIKGETEIYTLLFQGTETVEIPGTLKNKEVNRVVFYAYPKSGEVKKFLADDLERIEK